MEDMDKLLTDLKSQYEEIRLQAVKVIRNYNDERFLNALIEVLGDPSWRVRKEAQEAVLSFNDPSIIALLLPGLRDGDNAGRRNCVVETVIRLGPDIIQHVSGLLKDEDPDVRKFSLDILGSIDSPETVPLLMEALKDDDDNVVATATEFLGIKGDFRAVPQLLKLLEKDNFWLRFCSLRAIGQLADEEQEEEVLSFLENPSLRREAIDVLARIGREKSFNRLLDWYRRGKAHEKSKIMGAVTSILSRLCTTDAEKTRELINIISKSGLDEEFEKHLRDNIQEGAGEERLKAIMLAGFFPSSVMMETLIGAIESSDEEERDDLCRALTLFPDEFLPSLFLYLGSDSTLIKRKVTWVFGQKKYKPALPKLLPLIKDEDGHVRSSVSIALGHIGDKSAIMPLYNLLGDPYPDVRESAVSSLTEIAAGDEKLGRMISEIITSSLDNEKEHVTEGALLVLGNIQDASKISIFARYLKDARVKVRRAALNGLGRLKTDKAINIILTALTDEDPDIRTETIRYLGKTGDEKFREAVAAMVHDEDNIVAAEALQSLGNIGGKGSSDVLIKAALQSAGLKQLSAIKALCAIGGKREYEILTSLLPDVAPESRNEIITFLGKMKDSASLSFLISCLKDSDWSIRLAAAKAIGNISDREAIEIMKKEYYHHETDQMVRSAMEKIFQSQSNAE